MEPFKPRKQKAGSLPPDTYSWICPFSYVRLSWLRHVGFDLDVMVLLDMKEERIKKYSEQVLDLAVELTTRYGIVVSIQENNFDFFNEWVDILPFFSNVRREGVELYGR